MITIIILFGLFILTLGAVAIYSKKIAAILLIPAVYGFYYFASTEVPKYFGYPISYNFVMGDMQSRFLYGFKGTTDIYILIFEKDASEPRLIKIPNTEANAKKLAELSTQSKKGQAAFLKKKGKKGNGEPTAGSGVAHETDEDIEFLSLEDQDIIKKGE